MNISRVDFPANLTIPDLIKYQSRMAPTSEYLVVEDSTGDVKRLSFGELDDVTARVAGGLARVGIHKGDRLLIMMRNSVEAVVTMLASARSGIVTVPINTAYVAEDVRHIWDLLGPRGFVIHGEYADRFVGLPGDRANGVLVGGTGVERGQSDGDGMVNWDQLLAADPLKEEPRIAGDDILQLVMTSGTTSRPKAVTHTHRNRVRSGFRQTMWNRLSRTDRVFNAFPIFHVNCLDGAIFASLVAGSTAITVERFSATRFWQQVRTHKATVISVLPTVIRAMMAQPVSTSDRDHNVRLVGCGLQAREDELDAFKARFGLRELVAGYGLTEASTSVLQTPLEGELRYPSMGIPMIDRTVMLVDENDVAVPVGATGEIVVLGEPGVGVMQGYYRDPEATEAALKGGWLHTGDLAYCDEDGYFYFAGRIKDMIKRSGENIGTQEVESVLLSNPAVDEVAVIGVPDSFRDEAVMAVVKLVSGAHLNIDELRSFCDGRLADFKIPTQLAIVDELPRGLLGKVDKKRLRDLYQTSRASG